MDKRKSTASPSWSNTTKIIVNVLFLALIFGMLLKFSNLITPLVIALFLALLFHPVAEFIHSRLHIPWNLAVTLIFILTALCLITLIAAGGFALIEQIQALIVFLQRNLPNLPIFLAEISAQKFRIGPFELDPNQINWTELGNQLINILQPILVELGNLIGSLASGTAQVVITIFFSLIISYFLVVETGGTKERLWILNIPGYQDDLERMGKEISLIWNSFLKGQALVIFIRVLLYIVLLGSLRVNFFVGLAIGAGIANLIPYIGVTIAWITYFFVALFQGTTIFGLDSFTYALLVAGSACILDNIYDNTVTPRIMGGALKLHPAAIMIAALAGANLFGLMGMILAAPVLASLKLVFHYVQKKMLDQDPWEDFERIYAKESDLPLTGRIAKKIQTKYKKKKNSKTNGLERRKNESGNGTKF